MNEFRVGELLVKGEVADIWQGVHLSTGTEVHIVIVNKRKMGSIIDQERLEYLAPLAILQLNNSHLLKYYKIVHSEQQIGIIVEQPKGSNLRDYLLKRQDRKISETEARKLFIQIISALETLFAHRIIHRNLNLRNIFVDPKGNLKVGDFLICSNRSPICKPNSTTSTYYFYAPEIWLEDGSNISWTADIWSLGVLLYVMTCGVYPFDGKDEFDIFLSVKRGQFSVPKTLSPECANLIAALLNPNPGNRPTLQVIMAHPWVQNRSAPQEMTLNDSNNNNNGSTMNNSGEIPIESTQFANKQITPTGKRRASDSQVQRPGNQGQPVEVFIPQYPPQRAPPQYPQKQPSYPPPPQYPPNMGYQKQTTSPKISPTLNQMDPTQAMKRHYESQGRERTIAFTDNKNNGNNPIISQLIQPQSPHLAQPKVENNRPSYPEHHVVFRGRTVSDPSAAKKRELNAQAPEQNKRANSPFQSHRNMNTEEAIGFGIPGYEKISLPHSGGPLPPNGLAMTTDNLSSSFIHQFHQAQMNHLNNEQLDPMQMQYLQQMQFHQSNQENHLIQTQNSAQQPQVTTFQIQLEPSRSSPSDQSQMQNHNQYPPRQQFTSYPGNHLQQQQSVSQNEFPISLPDAEFLNLLGIDPELETIVNTNNEILEESRLEDFAQNPLGEQDWINECFEKP